MTAFENWSFLGGYFKVLVSINLILEAGKSGRSGQALS
jgi:hypothetical protein